MSRGVLLDHSSCQIFQLVNLILLKLSSFHWVSVSQEHGQTGEEGVIPMLQLSVVEAMWRGKGLKTLGECLQCS